ncbi:MAG TPA: phosphotransferase [Chthoniobacterales bacterium]|nr:phosphotransferase [Chthoniobacterales bacterium]
MAELEKGLQQPVRACELHHENWRNRTYRVELASGAVVIAKQILIGTEGTVHRQADELECLSRLQVPGLHVPKPVALLPEKRVLIMEFAPGQTITALLLSRARAEEGMRACELAGAVLARLHRAWAEAVCPLPVKQLADDMAAAPWRLSRRQRETLSRTLKELGAARVSVGRIHYDYEPDNLLWDGEQLFLIDPSDGSHWGVQLFEVATFRSAVRRRLFMERLRRPFGWRRGLLNRAIRGFERSYLAEGSGGDLEPRLFTLAIGFFELQRAAQLFVGEKVTIDIARRKDVIGWQNEGSLINWAKLGLVEGYKCWLFSQLARELRGG